jgi:hypothetical protein
VARLLLGAAAMSTNKTALVLGFSVVFAVFAGGCTASTNDAQGVSADEAELNTSAAATKAAIRKAVGVFAGGEDKLTHSITLAQVPASVRAKLTSAHADAAAYMDSNDWPAADCETGHLRGLQVEDEPHRRGIRAVVLR